MKHNLMLIAVLYSGDRLKHIKAKCDLACWGAYWNSVQLSFMSDSRVGRKHADWWKRKSRKALVAMVTGKPTLLLNAAQTKQLPSNQDGNPFTATHNRLFFISLCSIGWLRYTFKSSPTICFLLKLWFSSSLFHSDAGQAVSHKDCKRHTFPKTPHTSIVDHYWSNLLG